MMNLPFDILRYIVDNHFCYDILLTNKEWLLWGQDMITIRIPCTYTTLKKWKGTHLLLNEDLVDFPNVESVFDVRGLPTNHTSYSNFWSKIPKTCKTLTIKGDLCINKNSHTTTNTCYQLNLLIPDWIPTIKIINGNVCNCRIFVDQLSRADDILFNHQSLMLYNCKVIINDPIIKELHGFNSEVCFDDISKQYIKVLNCQSLSTRKGTYTSLKYWYVNDIISLMDLQLPNIRIIISKTSNLLRLYKSDINIVNKILPYKHEFVFKGVGYTLLYNDKKYINKGISKCLI